jgi:tRNA G18 (ribose-2'-O)-methylase SpoU
VSIERLERAGDNRLEKYRNVRDADLLRAHSLFVAEGRLVVRRVVEDGHFDIESVLVNDAALRDLGGAIGRLDGAIPVYVCPTDLFRDLTGFNLHRGCLALVRRPPPTPLPSLLACAATIVVLDAVANADNVGGIMRNAAAFGAGGVVLSPTSCDPLYRKAIRTSMGAALLVPFARCDDAGWAGLVADIRDAGFTVVALTPREPSIDLDALAARRRPPKVALVVGAEGTGLTPHIEAAADHRVRIPTTDRVDSLNVAVATGIALYRLGR